MSKFSIHVEPAKVSNAIALEAIALEANFVANAIDLAKQYLPSVVSHFKSFSSGLNFNSNELKSELTKSQIKIFTDLDKVDYQDIVNDIIDIPEGFDYKIINALKDTEDILDNIKSVISFTNDYYKYLSVFISNKDQKKSLKDLTKVAKEKAYLESTKAVATVGNWYKPGIHKADQKYGKLFDNNKDVENSFKLYNRLNTEFNNINMDEYKTKIDDISDLLDLIINQIKEEKIDSITPEVLKNLSEASYTLAKATENTAVVYFKLIGFFNIFPNLEKTIAEKIIK